MCFRRAKKLSTDKTKSTAFGFVNMLKRLRRVFLQDSALLRLQHPDNLLFKHRLFDSDMYKSFAERVVIANDSSETPMNIQLRQVMPEMVSHVDVVRESMLGGLRELQASFAQDITMLAKGIEDFAEGLQDDREKDQKVMGNVLGNLAAGVKLMSSAVLETRMIFPCEGSGGSLDRPSTTTPPSTTENSDGIDPSLIDPTLLQPPTTILSPSRTAAPPNTLPSPTTPSSTSASHVFAVLEMAGQQGANMFGASGVAAASNTAPASVPDSASGDVFVIEKDHKTVRALWKEYDEGVLGRMSLREMLAKDLKKGECQRKRWERRKIVIKEIKRLMETRTTTAESIVKEMDVFMKSERLSMSKLQDRILKDKKEGKILPVWL
ncbi:hypothetical protein QFC20_001068 [Naganishia adeliensis]|uniref:Uncharacterized protein n=1 Tax=Naganishia adeliensis TaxID=92952 RepID=A0ACC2WVN8_9TREE|nr:hypothetical protein QFC20_001068 [Naganishia adeliensis]